MSEATKIEWATHTFNPWEGCTKVSPGCARCYAEARNHRFGMDNWGKGKPRRRTGAASWRNPVRWNKAANPVTLNWGQRDRVFPSLCDWLDDEVPIEWLADFLKLIQDTPNLDWLLLTKRPENWKSRMEAARCAGTNKFDPFSLPNNWLCNDVPKNVWLGVSVEDQQRANERIPLLLEIPTAVRFLSVEPLLGPVNIAPFLLSDYDKHGFDSQLVTSLDTRDGNKVDWVIIGGESGLGARPCNVEWIRDIVSDCNTYGVPCFVKQLGANIVDRNDAGFDGDDGEWPMDTHYREIDHGYQGAPVRVLLKHPKGGDPAEWPEDLRVRQFPNPTAVLCP